MKAINYLRFVVPALGLGAFLAMAPAARGQADVSPDHFDDGVTDSAPAKKAPAKAKPAAAVQASNKKASTKTTAQSAPAKKPAQAAQQTAVVAVSDKKKTPAKKSGNQ